MARILTGSFVSWRGDAGATSPFNNREGNRLYLMATKITSDTLISLDHVTVTITSAPNPILNMTKVYTSTNNYNSASVVGVQWVNGQGGGDDVTVSSGSASQGVNEIWFYLGPGNGVSAVNAAGSTNQDKLDNTADFIASNIGTVTFTVSYDHGGGNIESASRIIDVPEPASLALFGLGGTLVVVCRRKK